MQPLNLLNILQCLKINQNSTVCAFFDSTIANAIAYINKMGNTY